MIKFVELFDKVTFPEAVRQLAARAGLTVPEPEASQQDADDQRDRESLLKAHEIAAAWFTEQLAGPAGAAARRQLQERGVSPEMVKTLAIGYAPAMQDGLCARLKKDGFGPALIVKSGLAVQRDDGSLRDRFRNRLMIPICRDNGAIIAFGGRAMDAGPAAEVSEFAGNADLCQRPDALWFAPEQVGDRQGALCGDGRGLL